MTATERLSEWLWLVQGGVQAEIAAERVGATLNTIRKTATRVGDQDAARILDRLAEEASAHRHVERHADRWAA